MTIDRLIQREILRVLSEENKDKSDKDSKEKKKTVKAKPGRGRVKTYIQQAKARAADDPLGLMKSLKVNTAVRDRNVEFEEKIVEILRSAILGTSEMSTAFRGIRYTDKTDTAFITMEMLTPRDGVMFVNHIIVAAQNARLIELEKDIEVASTGDKVAVKFIQAK